MATPAKYQDLVAKYAPVFAQKVSNEWRVADQIAPVEIMGDITRVAENPEEIRRIA